VLALLMDAAHGLHTSFFGRCIVPLSLRALGGSAVVCAQEREREILVREGYCSFSCMHAWARGAAPPRVGHWRLSAVLNQKKGRLFCGLACWSHCLYIQAAPLVLCM
jgi:hypothetical protein